MKKSEENVQVNILTTKQNLDTPYITEQAEDDEQTEVDSDVNEDPVREWLLDQSAAAFANQVKTRDQAGEAAEVYAKRWEDDRI
ncbi:hypothetical protein ACI7RC_22115 [Brevibacillus sp. B_LB10_24]|uniref:hypothetical protein n=1 Tax=Brevibacillus sp. B_LB10_24 TaxID=3380645 RepID=UPI0038B6BAE4